MPLRLNVMARFIKGDKTSRPQSDDSPTETFDFAAIARDLNAQDGPSSFDSLLSKPADAAPQRTDLPASANGDNAGELPDFDELFAAPEVRAAPQAMPSPEAAPQVMTSPQAEAPALVEPLHAALPVPIAPPAASGVAGFDVASDAKKKRSRLVFAMGTGVAICVLAGATYLLIPHASDEIVDTFPPSITSPVQAPKPRIASAAAVTKPEAQTSPASASRPVVPTPTTAPRAVRPAPVSAAQLKALWDKGSEAKHRKDYASARRYWQQALQLSPHHPGFQDSIDKLPPQL